MFETFRKKTEPQEHACGLTVTRYFRRLVGYGAQAFIVVGIANELYQSPPSVRQMAEGVAIVFGAVLLILLFIDWVEDDC